ncbi:MAG: T9SS type A sorting domain-containing protein [Crocinitomicaceae bacterium]|nr:T9SS type A sorting domain-containing protein [Crocinitomicaceae bacterium]MBK8924362.1 T9SS type A sorting domain-containing protein [Crocinitomicaceae bacterium]
MVRKFLMLLTFTHTFLFAQYIPFPTDNTVWVNHQYSTGGWWPPEYTAEYLSVIDNFCVNNEDTLINTSLYTKLIFCDGAYRGAIRDNGGQIFFVSKDSMNEMLVYDFTVDVGDTLLNIYSDWTWFDTLYISDVSSMSVGGLYRKTIYLEDKNHNELPDYWIEGIGCSAGLLVAPSLNNNLSGIFVRLYCFSSNDSTFNYNYSYTGSGGCQLNYLSDDNFFEEQFYIFPNPTNEVLYIQIPNLTESFEITIYSALGDKVYSANAEPNMSKLSVPVIDWKPGIYFVTVKNSMGVYSRKFIRS